MPEPTITDGVAGVPTIEFVRVVIPTIAAPGAYVPTITED